MTTSLSEDVETRLGRLIDDIDARAGDLDAGLTDVRADLRALGAAGLLGGDDLPATVRVIEQVAAVSLAVGFSAWAQHMVTHYLGAGPSVHQTELRGSLAGAQRTGVTAMAAGIKQVAGLGQVPILAEERHGGLRVSGPIRWASNVFDDALIVLPARGADGRLYVVTVDADAPGVHVDPAPRLMALGATGSTSLRLEQVAVPTDRIISDDLVGFVHRIKPTFLLLQTAFCVGVTGAALAESGRSTDPLASQFDTELSDLAAAADGNRGRLYRFAEAPHRVDIGDIIRLRLDAANAAVGATRLESALAGGRGYRSGSATSRRFRETAFLPVQSPSEGQLRWELKRYE